MTVKTITGLTEPQEIDAVSFNNCFKVFDRSSNKDVLYLPVNTTETWAEHFIGTGSSSSPQFNNMNALITATPTNLNYLEPAPATGSYIEEFDFGTQLASTKITVTQGGNGVGSGSLTHSGIINTGTGDSGSFTDDGEEQTGTSFSRFGTQFQRVKYEVKETSNNGKYRKITSINVKLDTKILNDTGKGNVAPALTGSGTYSQSSSNTITISISNHGLLTGCFVTLDFTSGGQSSSGDGEYQITRVNNNSFTVQASSSGTSSGNVSFSTSGTPVYFNVNFVDIQGVNVTPNTTSPVISVVDFKDIPNPKSFQVLFFDPTDGSPITSGTTAFTWQCRGT